MDPRVIAKLYDLDPQFRELYDGLYPVAKADAPDLHVDSAGGDRRRKRGLAGGLLFGAAAEGTAVHRSVQAVRATPRYEKITDVPYHGVRPRVRAFAGSRQGKAAEAGLQTANLLVGLGAARELARKPKRPVAKAFALKPLNPTDVRRTPSLKTRRPGLVAPVAKSFTVRAQIAKIDTDKRQVFGWASVSEIDGKAVLDLQGDYMPIEEVEKSAYHYVLNSRIGGDQHSRVAKADTVPKHASDLIESMVFTDEKIAKMGLPEDFPRGWWCGFQVRDETVWQDIKAGRRLGLSVHGSGRREAVNV